MSYSCVIPVYNEAPRIKSVLDTVTKIKEVTEIISVDDGSTDGSAKIIEQFSRVTLVKHKDNLGKTAAIVSGLKEVKYENVILLDSDLIGLKIEDIRRAINIFENKDLDCLILSKAPMNRADALARKLFRALLCAAGERIIKTNLLKEALEGIDAKGYQLEIAQNKFLLDHNKKVAYMDISAAHLDKSRKEGLKLGLIKEAKMWSEIVKFAGFVFFIKQSLLFARKKVS